MKIYYSLYELKQKKKLGLSRSESRVGALLKVAEGYADLHPWPELGDLDLEEELRSIALGNFTALSRRSLVIAAEDGKARVEKRSLFAGLSIPTSHLLVDPSADHSLLVEQNFERVKWKCSSDLTALARHLESLVPMLQGTGLKVRLDFNECLDQYAFVGFLRSLSDDALDRIDFIEDPFVFESKSWLGISEKFHCHLALDRQNSAKLGVGFDVSVVKPAIHDPKPFLNLAATEMKRIVFTSYLDHPLGQLAAAFEAARAVQAHPYLLEPCGLLSHLNYEKNEFSELLQSRGPELLAPEGHGLGLGEILEKQEWIKLCD